MLSKKKSQKRNSFIQSLAQQNDKEISHDTAASIENMKIYDNYFGIQLNKNISNTKRNKSVKRANGASEYMNWKNLLSPTKELDLLRSISSLSKDSKGTFLKGKRTKNISQISSTNYTPKLKSECFNKQIWSSNVPTKNEASINIYDSGSDLFKNFAASDFMCIGAIKKKTSTKIEKENIISGNLLKQETINKSINCDSKSLKKKSINIKSK